MAKCRGCGAPIEFIKTPTGKMLPVDQQTINFIPGSGKGERKFVTDQGRVVSGIPVGDAHEGGYEIGYVPHWATCPEADKFRKRG